MPLIVARVAGGAFSVRTPQQTAISVIDVIALAWIGVAIVLNAATLIVSPLDDDELESLLAHECPHVARRDNFIALIEALLRAVFWFNPLSPEKR